MPKKCPSGQYYSKDSERCVKFSPEEQQLIKDLSDAWNDKDMSGAEVLDMLEKKYSAEHSWVGGSVTDTLWIPQELRQQDEKRVMSHMFFNLSKDRVEDDVYWFTMGRLGNTTERKILKKNIRVKKHQSTLGGF